ncbi:ABC1-B atypical protein kinase [Microbotryum lychnidis-dioicae p1A1 Lamole]|uniref:ABC1-B atypical protein kinase n=1 Tax=Microbotryum lychnidis-dioicae (strain p1A1 Lamole / MvSl-1064) TaxID=683840 RepID=U5HIG8_USTV1|nr:ABC1-B atypical protein kinase [Microbotryum lychnidis-dioicae p1A1 Lamole]|eukprot:KDE02639.1 ABC1-B atypical protein kinase [Microbotryum lychnidis-dioicae p1A1 Lamole]
MALGANPLVGWHRLMHRVVSAASNGATSRSSLGLAVATRAAARPESPYSIFVRNNSSWKQCDRSTSLSAIPRARRTGGVLQATRTFQSFASVRNVPASTAPSTKASIPSKPASGPASSTATTFSFPRGRHSYARQLLRLRAELALLRRRLPPLKPTRRSLAVTLSAVAVGLTLLYNLSATFRRLVTAIDRCSRVGIAVAQCIVDYKILFRGEWPDTPEGQQQRHQAYENCHSKCAVRIREVLKKNGGIYIKLGQHLSSVQLIPLPWSQAMIPLQDQCKATPLAELQQLFLDDAGAPLSTFFSSFDPNPIGVASLAQVHRATLRDTGEQVAVKVMHPDLEEFCQIDMKTTTLMLRVVKSMFPSFEFTWLGEEMEENLPLEMDFRHEAANASRCQADFSELKTTSLVIPKVIWAKKRVMVMQFIEGARIDDLAYLEAHQIDRNEVSKELSRIFSRMIYITGFFHADPHGGNLLIRPAQPGSRSRSNFEIVLLDHGLYFEMDSALRVAYARLWLALISPSSPKVEAERRKYAYLAGNIDDELYPIFQAAITGRAALDDPYAVRGDEGDKKGSVMELGEHTLDEQKRMRHTIAETEGLMTSIFDLLRRVPRRILMVLKVNDLARALDTSLHTTHSPARIFMIVAEYCNLAAYLDDLAQLRTRYHSRGLSFGLAWGSIRAWTRYQSWNLSLTIAIWWTDLKARWSSPRRGDAIAMTSL